MNQHLTFFQPFKSDIWSVEQQQEIYEKYLKIETLGEWTEFCATEDFKLVMETLSFDPAPYSKTAWPIKQENWLYHTVLTLTNVDFPELHNRATELNQNMTAQDAEYKEARTTQRENWQTERAMVKNLGLDKNPHIIYINQENFPELMPFLDSLDLEYYNAQLRNNYIGSNLPTHTDALDHLWVKIDELYPEENIMDRPFDHLTKSIEGFYPIRLLMHIDDWEPGQVVGFKDKLWTWKAGECIMFDWQNVKHYASNVSYKNRYQIRVTGFTRNPHHWIFEAVNSGSTRVL